MSNHILPWQMTERPSKDPSDHFGSDMVETILPASGNSRGSTKTSRTRSGESLDQDFPSKRKRISLLTSAFVPSTINQKYGDPSASSSPKLNDKYAESYSPAALEDTPLTSEGGTNSATPEKQNIEEDNCGTELLEHQMQIDIAQSMYLESLNQLPKEEIRALSERCQHRENPLADRRAAKTLIMSKHKDAPKDCADTNDILEHASVEASYVCNQCINESVAAIVAETNASDHHAAGNESDGVLNDDPRSSNQLVAEENVSNYQPLEQTPYGAANTYSGTLEKTVPRMNASNSQTLEYLYFDATNAYPEVSDQPIYQRSISGSQRLDYTTAAPSHAYSASSQLTFDPSSFQPLSYPMFGASTTYPASSHLTSQGDITAFQPLNDTTYGASNESIEQSVSGMNASNLQTPGYASLGASNANPESSDQVDAQYSVLDLPVFMARDLPDGREVFRGLQEIQGPVEYFIQYGSLPPVAINRNTGRATSMSGPADAVRSEVLVEVILKDVVPGVAVSEVVETDTVISEDVPADVVLEDAISNAAVSGDLFQHSAADDDSPRNSVPKDVAAQPVATESVAPQEDILEKIVLENYILEAIVPESIPSEPIVTELIASEEETSEAIVVEDDILKISVQEVIPEPIDPEVVWEAVIPRDITPEAADQDIVFSEANAQGFDAPVAKETKRSKKTKLKKKRKIEAEPIVSQETQNATLLLEIQRRLQGCAEKLKEPVREMQKCLEVFLLHLSKTGTSGNAQNFETNFLDCVKSAECDVEILGQHVRLATAVLFPPELEVSSAIAQTTDNTSNEPKFLDGNAATASWICSSPTPDSQIKESSKETVVNTNPSLAEINSSTVPFGEKSPDLFAVSIPSNASQSHATPSEELSFSLTSTPSEAATMFQEKSSPALDQALPHEVVTRSWCSCRDSAEKMVSEVESRELRNPFSSFRRPPITRINSLPFVGTPALREDAIVVQMEQESDPTKPPPTSTTHIPVTRKIVKALLSQDLPVYASWQVWYYPGPFTRGKGPRMQQIPMQVKVASVGQHSDHKPTWLVPKLGRTFDSRYVVSLEDGSFLPVIPQENEHKHIMLSYRDYLNYDFLLSLNVKLEHRMYNFQQSVLDGFKAHMAQKSVTPQDRTLLMALLSNVWEQMKAAGIQRLNENIKFNLQTQNKWKVKVEQHPWAFYKVSETALKKWNKLRYELQKINPMTVDQAQLCEITKLFSLVESAVVAGMTKAFKDKDPECYYDVDMEVELGPQRE